MLQGWARERQVQCTALREIKAEIERMAGRRSTSEAGDESLVSKQPACARQSIVHASLGDVAALTRQANTIRAKIKELRTKIGIVRRRNFVHHIDADITISHLRSPGIRAALNTYDIRSLRFFRNLCSVNLTTSGPSAGSVSHQLVTGKQILRRQTIFQLVTLFIRNTVERSGVPHFRWQHVLYAADRVQPIRLPFNGVDLTEAFRHVRYLVSLELPRLVAEGQASLPLPYDKQGTGNTNAWKIQRLRIWRSTLSPHILADLEKNVFPSLAERVNLVVLHDKTVDLDAPSLVPSEGRLYSRPPPSELSIDNICDPPFSRTMAQAVQERAEWRTKMESGPSRQVSGVSEQGSDSEFQEHDMQT
jgi:hypothetical protein